MIQEIYTSIFGVHGTADRGFISEVKDMSKQLRAINGAVKTNTVWRKALIWIIGIIILAIVASFNFPLPT